VWRPGSAPRPLYCHAVGFWASRYTSAAVTQRGSRTIPGAVRFWACGLPLQDPGVNRSGLQKRFGPRTGSDRRARPGKDLPNVGAHIAHSRHLALARKSAAFTQADWFAPVSKPVGPFAVPCNSIQPVAAGGNEFPPSKGGARPIKLNTSEIVS